MLREIGITDVEEIYQEIPESLRFKGQLKLPEAMMAEADLKRHLQKLLKRNVTCEDNLCFLGGGCARHHVPAVVDEIINRSEFLTAYCGSIYSDSGKYQARFEFNSMMGELLQMDVVSEPTYDWGSAAGSAIRMASRLTGRRQVLVPANLSPERMAVIRTFCQPESMANAVKIVVVKVDSATGQIDLTDLKAHLSEDVAAVYLENPNYWGQVEGQAGEAFRLAREQGAIGIAGVDPLSLGVLEAPGLYGADIAVGDLQSLGIHMSYGGGVSGFLAFHDHKEYAEECPLALYSIAETVKDEYIFGEVMAERTSYGTRDQGKDWVGTASGLYTIGAAVYLALMGPQGMQEIGETIIQRAHYAARALVAIDQVKVIFTDSFFKEFVVDFSATGKSVAEINSALLEKGIFGGIDLGKTDTGMLGKSLYCVTEMCSKEDIDYLVKSVREVLK
jgi:glycine dehydrogenase subunit 1